MAETNNNTIANNDVTTKTVKIVPNEESWRYIKIGNVFTNCLNMKSNSIYGISNSADTHLMKKNGWKLCLGNRLKLFSSTKRNYIL